MKYKYRYVTLKHEIIKQLDSNCTDVCFHVLKTRGLAPLLHSQEVLFALNTKFCLTWTSSDGLEGLKAWNTQAVMNWKPKTWNSLYLFGRFVKIVGYFDKNFNSLGADERFALYFTPPFKRAWCHFPVFFSFHFLFFLCRWGPAARLRGPARTRQLPPHRLRPAVLQPVLLQLLLRQLRLSTAGSGGPPEAAVLNVWPLEPKSNRTNVWGWTWAIGL